MAEEAGRAELRELVLRSARGEQKREFAFDSDGPRSWDPEKRTLEIEFSSEEPYERFWGGKIGKEILSHEPGACDLSRLNNTAPLLYNHYGFLGSIRKAWIGDDRRGRSKVRFGKNALAENYLPDVISGDLCKVSVGYDVEDLEIREGDNGDTVFFVTKWTPYENSIVDIAADDTVGTRSKEENISSKSSPKEKANHQNEKRSEEKMPENTPTPEAPAAPAVDVKAVEAKARQEARKAEKARATEVRALARQAEMSDEDVDSFLDGEGSVDEFRQVVVEKLVGQKKLTPVKESSDEDYREKGREFSILRMIRHRAHPGEQKFAEEAAYEREVCADAEKRFARTNQEGFIVPWTVLGQKRDLGVADNLYGGYTAKNTYGSMIEKLEQEQVTTRAGATTLAGLQGDLYIPKHTGGGTAYWVDEDGSATASTQTFGQLMLRPHTVTAMTNIHRRFYLQSSVDAENFVRQDLILRILLADDLAALHGTAANGQPRGLANVSGIGSVAIGDNGGAITFSLLVDLEKQLAQDNALLGRRAYVTNTKMACEMKQTVEHATLNGAGWVWKGGVGDGATGTVNGYPAFASNQVSSTLTKGDNSDCSAIFFGNWAEMIKARFGGLDIKVDPYTNADSGAVRVAVFQDVDVAVRHPESFAAILDARDAA